MAHKVNEGLYAGDVTDREEALGALGVGASGAAAEVRGSVDDLEDAVRRRRAAGAWTPGVIAALARDEQLDALAADDASALPAALRERAQGWLDGLVAALLACFDGAGVGAAPATAPELDVILERTGLTELRGPIVARMREDTAEFVARAARGLARNPILVALAAELAELPEALVQPLACASAHGATRAAEVRLFVTHAQVLDAIASECLLEARGGADHPAESMFIHRMFVATVARLDRVDWRPHVTLFERMKVPSIQGPFRRKYMDFKTGARAFDDEASGGHSLQMNILEAMFQDTLLGWDDNAAAGFELFCQSVDKAPQPVLGEDFVREWALDGQGTGVPLSVPAFARAWANLYTSWNAAFCANYEELPFFLAKLFNPAVAAVHHDRHPGLYLYTRIVTLLVHITFVMASRDHAGWGPRFSELAWRHDRLNLLWGRINRAAAEAYQRRVEAALEREEGLRENLRHDVWRAAKVGGWAALRSLTRSIRIGGELGDEAGAALLAAKRRFGLDE